MMERQVNILISLQADVFSLTGCHFPPLLSLEDMFGDSFSALFRNQSNCHSHVEPGCYKYPFSF